MSNFFNRKRAAIAAMYEANQNDDSAAVEVAIDDIMLDEGLVFRDPSVLEAETTAQMRDGFYSSCATYAADDKYYFFDLCDTYIDFSSMNKKKTEQISVKHENKEAA